MMSEPASQQREHDGGYLDAIPARLQKRNQWIVTNGKKPIKPRDDWSEPGQQLSFDCAFGIARDPDLELAFALLEEDPFVVIDFDNVGQPDGLPSPVEECVDKLDTYTEVSRSGDGLHLVCEGTKLPDRKPKGKIDRSGTVEVYDSGQYIVLTGDINGSATGIASGRGRLHDFQRAYLPKRTEPSDEDSQESNSTTEFALETVGTVKLSLNPIDIRRTVREYASGGSKSAQRTLRLWQSPAGSDDRYISGSEADLALCSDLAFWCREDARLMDRCFRKSNRLREKWDEVHYGDGKTYGDATIETAIITNYDRYTGDRYVVWK